MPAVVSAAIRVQALLLVDVKGCCASVGDSAAQGHLINVQTGCRVVISALVRAWRVTLVQHSESVAASRGFQPRGVLGFADADFPSGCVDGG